jgi:selenocysteine-specific elongation factor
MQLLADGDVPSLVRAALQGAPWPVTLGQVAPAGVLDAGDARSALAELTAMGELVAFPGAEPAWLTAARYAELSTEVRTALERHAAGHPLEPAVPAGSVVPAGPGADALLARLAADGVLERDGAHVLLAGAHADAHGSHAAEARALLDALAGGGFSPPDLPALQRASTLSERDFAALCTALERSGALVRFGGDLAYTAERFDEARDLVLTRCTEDGSIALAELRDALGASRRIAQGLLERLDADGVTRRVEDRRVLRRRAPR